MKSKEQVRQEMISLFRQLKNQDLPMWKDLEIRSKFKALEWVLSDD
jgi:hypothetical protein